MRFVSFAGSNSTRVRIAVHFLLIAGIALAFGPSISAQESATRFPFQSARLGRPPEILPRDAAELEIALGRIRLVPDRFRIVRKHEQFDWPMPGADTAESNPAKLSCARSLQIATQDGRPTAKLSYSDPQEKWSLCVDNIVGAEWTRELLDAHPPIQVQYTQRPHQHIVIKIDGVGAKQIVLSSQTLWHLTEENSPEFQRYVLPALVRLNHAWDLPQALAAAKRMRGYAEPGQATAAKHELAQSIAELDSSDRRMREMAKQKLRDTGLAAQIPLEQLRGGPLSPQQRSTVEELLAELEPRSADTPTRLAYWLSGDPNWR